VAIKSKYRGKRLYKYFNTRKFGVVDGLLHSPIGLDLDWSLPEGRKFGAWQVFHGEPVVCVRGLHAWVGGKSATTYYAHEQINNGAKRLFRVQVDTRHLKRGYKKIVVTRMRLMSEVKPGTRAFEVWKKS
jgi:hypothetical protein